MNQIILQNTDFKTIYNRSYKLAAAVFMVSNVMEKDEELKTKIKNLALNLVSLSVNLKDINFLEVRKLITDIEKNSLELMSVLDIAAVSGLISKMNAGVLKEEFESFVLELNKFSDKFENDKNTSVKSLFNEYMQTDNFSKSNGEPVFEDDNNYVIDQKILIEKNKLNVSQNSNGHKRKDLRKSAVLEFIKGHNNVSIKDIVPNITGCSEKTIQRELISLINDGKVKKSGERRWSRYSVV